MFQGLFFVVTTKAQYANPPETLKKIKNSKKLALGILTMVPGTYFWFCLWFLFEVTTKNLLLLLKTQGIFTTNLKAFLLPSKNRENSKTCLFILEIFFSTLFNPKNFIWLKGHANAILLGETRNLIWRKLHASPPKKETKHTIAWETLLQKHKVTALPQTWQFVLEIHYPAKKRKNHSVPYQAVEFQNLYKKHP